ncbi:hypothetical protein HGM15179_018801 [Zosterops borbonicus]|uniref:Uncharacterized protein n=1 Tax=Zosterops borbonicus TaxID=364589 RepID=A0A8K1D9B4_9PASS|nr:hypothetical protein HGM15179_018801 [Zosterops borbonicus]
MNCHGGQNTGGFSPVSGFARYTPTLAIAAAGTDPAGICLASVEVLNAVKPFRDGEYTEYSLEEPQREEFIPKIPPEPPPCQTQPISPCPGSGPGSGPESESIRIKIRIRTQDLDQDPHQDQDQDQD